MHLFFFFFQMAGAPDVLPSSPTRRSSDLGCSARASRGERPMTTPAGSAHAVETITAPVTRANVSAADRSEEHTSELQSHSDLVCRLLLEKKKKQKHTRLPASSQ